MHHDIQIFNVSFLVVLILLGIAVARVTFAAYGSTFAGRPFGYTFDKTRLPLWGRSAAGVMAIFFAYMFIATGNLGYAIGFSLPVIPFVMLGSLISICYVSTDSKKRSIPKQTKKQAKTSSKDKWKLP